MAPKRAATWRPASPSSGAGSLERLRAPLPLPLSAAATPAPNAARLRLKLPQGDAGMYAAAFLPDTHHLHATSSAQISLSYK